jgi:HprK-related kinase A
MSSKRWASSNKSSVNNAPAIGALPLADLYRRLSGDGVALDFGATRVRVRSALPAIAQLIHLVYGAFPTVAAAGFFDVTARVQGSSGWRRWLRPQINFIVDGQYPFEPFPADTHLPMLEWGLNWCIAGRCNQHLLLHAAVVERDGVAIVLPALPGSGKSTLTAALLTRGFRLLSDEFGVVDFADGRLIPLVRPIALKNESIDVIRELDPHAKLGPVFPKTRKGDVAHLAPDARSVAARHEPARPRLILFPAFEGGAGLELERVAKARAFVKVSGNSFNYEILGAPAFAAVARLVTQCESYRLRYGDLQRALDAVEELLRNLPAAENVATLAPSAPH